MVVTEKSRESGREVRDKLPWDMGIDFTLQRGAVNCI
jgi:hypothetical protein